MAGNNSNTCSICLRKVPTNARKIKCDCCLSFIHKNCSNLFQKDFRETLIENRSWSCSFCNEQNFPFNNIIEDEMFYACIQTSDISNDRCTSNQLFVPFEINDNDYIHQDSNADPDLNFYNQEQFISNLNSKYYQKKGFLEYVRSPLKSPKHCFSCIHINIRSANANLKSFEAYLDSLDFSFNCIGLTETWFNESNCNILNVMGYNKIDKMRSGRLGGGVSILLKDDILFKERSDLSIINDDIECVFVEATIIKKVLIGVIYRPPNRRISDFNEQLKSIMDQVNVVQLPCCLMGDTNINVLNHTTHKETSDYLDLMYSYSLVPVINRPTRITCNSATLIDHIFTSNFNAASLYQGILVTDISDHYPVFHIAQYERKNDSTDEYFYKRIMSPTNYEYFHNEVSEIDWSIVTNSKVCQDSFSVFYNKIKSCFNKSFPITKIRKGYRNRLPWLTEDLKRAIARKNKLYVKSLKHDTAFNKLEYSQFKSSLQQQMKKREKEYYNDLIEKKQEQYEKNMGCNKKCYWKKEKVTEIY